MKSYVRECCVMLGVIIFPLLMYAQPRVIKAEIQDNRSNVLQVTFSESISVSSAEGFRLVGGTARIKSLLGGSGSSTLFFSLTDFVLPDDHFSLLYWQEIGDAKAASGRLLGFEDLPVANQTDRYHGSGTIYYVSTSGNDAFKGTSPQAPFRNPAKALSLAKPGDFVLLKRGDSWENVNQLAFSNHGSTNKYIVLSAYGEGKKPLLVGSLSNEAVLINRSFVQLDNIHVLAKDNLYGILNTNNAESVIISNSIVEAVDRSPSSGRTDHAIFFATSGVKNPIIINNTVSGARWGISSSGFPYSETNGIPDHQVYGGLVENNSILNTADASFSGNDGVQMARGDYNGIIIRKNKIFQWADDGIDTYLGFNLIIEYNSLTNPRNSAANAIKCGGVARGGNEMPVGRKSTGIVVRYNHIFDINLGSNNHAINTNDGGQATIYGNLAYNISGSGCQVSGDINRFDIFNNTFINCNYGISCWTNGNNAGEIYISNNILEGSSNDVNANTRGTGQNMKGANNILINNKTGGNYEGNNDLAAQKNALFVDGLQNNFILTETSPAIDKGLATPGYNKDLHGNLIHNKTDIGALEYH